MATDRVIQRRLFAVCMDEMFESIKNAINGKFCEHERKAGGRMQSK